MTALGLLLIAQVATATSGAAPEVSRYVIAVGYNQAASDGLAPLRYADDDAARFYEVLAPAARAAHLLVAFDAPSQQIFSGLVDRARRPTRDTLLRAIDDVRARAREDAKAGRLSELYFFYAGHGDADGDMGFVSLADGRFDRTDLRERLLSEPRPDRLHVIVDACKSFLFVAGRGAGGRREAEYRPFAGPLRLPGVGYVLSTSSDADSHEWAAFSGGVFSHEVRSGLLGAADADADGHVTYGELAAFIAVANEAVPYPRYRPEVFVQAPPDRRDAPLFTPAAASSAKLVIDAPGAGRLSITDSRGLRYLDVHKAAGIRLELALLEPWRYDVEWRSRHFRLDPAGGGQRLSQLPPDPGYLAERGAAHDAFDHLFGAPYGPSVVRGFALGSGAGARLQGPVVTKAPASFPWLPTALTGAGISAVAGGAVLTVLSANARADLPGAAQQDVGGLERRANALEIAGGVALGSAVALLGTGLYLFLVD